MKFKYKFPQPDPTVLSSQEGIALFSSLPPFFSSCSIIHQSIHPSFPIIFSKYMHVPHSKAYANQYVFLFVLVGKKPINDE